MAFRNFFDVFETYASNSAKFVDGGKTSFFVDLVFAGLGIS